jgi:hypothetical protein
MTDNSRRLTTSDIAASDENAALAARDAADAREARDTVVDMERRPEERLRRDTPSVHPDEPATPLFVNENADAYRARWSGIQAGFVDEPRHAVEEADALVAETMRRLAEVFADERRNLESQWEHTERVSTEDLRLAMRRYRSFFERLLSV